MQDNERGRKPGAGGLEAGTIVELLKKHRDSQVSHAWPEKMIGRVAASLATVWSVYLHILLFGLWILSGTGLLPIPHLDPDLRILALVASLESIFIATFVLIAQRRMQELAEVRANLTLHIGLLEERENTRLMHLVTRISEKLGIQVDGNEELSELMEDLNPEELFKEFADASALARNQS